MRSGKGSGPVAEINVTPLVDVCLVLLIIFMVVTPLIKNAADVVLPEARHPDKLGEREREAIVAIRADGSVWLEGRAVERPALVACLVELRGRRPGVELLLRGDRLARYRDVRSAMALANEAGFEKVRLAARPTDEADGRGGGR